MNPQPSRHEEPFAISKTDLSKIAEAGGPASFVDQIFALVAGAIQSKRLQAGVRMPSVRQMAAESQISRDTAARAYDKLVAHGLLESRRGSGFFVRSSEARKATKASRPSLFQHGLSADSRFRLALVRPPQTLQSRTGTGYLAENWIDEEGVAAALRSVARSSQRGVALPGDPQGYLPLRDQLQLKLHDIGIHTDSSTIVVTGGATDAIDLIVSTFLNAPGERVLVEQPCQPLLVERLMASGLEILDVPRRPDGPDVGTLRALCQKHRPRFFFCNSVLHNPTCSNMAPHVAFQTLRLAEEFDLTIVEDDSYCDLLPPAAPSATRLAALDQLKRVIYVGSLTKTLAGGLRVGYLAARPEHVEWLATYRALNCIAANILAERVAYRLLSQGNYRHHCEQLRSRLAEARPRVARALRSLGMRIPYEPDAGLYLWADLGQGVDAFAVAGRMLEQGHLLAPGRLFSNAHDSYMRFNVTEPLDNRLLSSLAQALGRQTS